MKTITCEKESFISVYRTCDNKKQIHCYDKDGDQTIINLNKKEIKQLIKALKAVKKEME